MTFISANLANLTAKQRLAECLRFVPLKPIFKLISPGIIHRGY